MADGVTVTVAISLKEVVDEFCASLPEGIQATVAFDGFRDIRVVRNKDRPNHLLFIERWESEAAYNAYIKWRTETGAMADLAAVVTAPPTREIWPTVVAAGCAA